jgi:hypothetical protein
MLARRRTQHRSDRLCDLGAIEVVRFAQSVILDQHIDHHFVRLDRVDREMRARMSPEVGHRDEMAMSAPTSAHRGKPEEICSA